jgi:hypothetical protein
MNIPQLLLTWMKMNHLIMTIAGRDFVMQQSDDHPYEDVAKVTI